MQIRVNSDSVEIDGYVNAVERNSKPLKSRMGNFIEKIRKGAFQKALGRSDDVRLLLNHNWGHDLGGTKDGNLKLVEDNIGLKARATITDDDVVRKARNGDLVGWSFGFADRDVDFKTEDGIPTREVKDLDLYEVSILDRSMSPAYEGTLISVRAGDAIQYWGEPFADDPEIREEGTEPRQHEDVEEEIDYTEYETMIMDMREEK